MRQTAIGKSELRVGQVAFGCSHFLHARLADASLRIETALDCGLTLIDTADLYGIGSPEGLEAAETLLGQVLDADKSLRQRMV